MRHSKTQIVEVWQLNFRQKSGKVVAIETPSRPPKFKNEWGRRGREASKTRVFFVNPRSHATNLDLFQTQPKLLSVHGYEPVQDSV